MAENVQPRKTVLSSKYTKGPHGLGDPDDKSLRKVEKDILIPQKIRERSRREKCVEEVKAFNECGKKAGLALTFRCKEEKNVLVDCLALWFYDEKFREECKREYLEERSTYRRTGIGVKQQKKHAAI